MATYNRRALQLLFLAGDLVLINLAFVFAGALRFREIQIQNTDYFDDYIQLAVVVNLLWLVLSLSLKTYDTAMASGPRKSVGKSIAVWLGHLLLLALLLVVLKKGQYSRLFISYFYLFSGLLVFTWHFLFLRILRAYRRKGYWSRRVAVIGKSHMIDSFAKEVRENSELGLILVGTHPINSEGKPESYQGLWQFLETAELDEIYIALEHQHPMFEALYSYAENHVMRFRVLPDLGVPPGRNLSVEFYGESPVLTLNPEPLNYWHNRFLKRLLDILVSLFVIVFIFPWLFPILAIIVKLSSPGPIFFRQQRSGYRGKVFSVVKFRTMYVNSNSDRLQASPNDNRVTPVGKWLRKYHLDEFPQFWLCLKGEMSVVGPRPHMLAHTEAYRQRISAYMLRHFGKPGLTGLAQVKGLRGPHDLHQMQERVKVDAYYLENWSILLDLSIIFQTIWLRGE